MSGGDDEGEFEDAHLVQHLFHCMESLLPQKVTVDNTNEIVIFVFTGIYLIGSLF